MPSSTSGRDAQLYYLAGTDIGGTFVDAVLLDSAGRITYGKAPTTPDSPSRGLLAAVTAAARSWGLNLSQVMERCQLFLHGTTVTTNAMIQRTGGPTALLITHGFEDTLPIGRVLARTIGLDEAGLMDRQHTDPPPALIPYELTRGIAERVDYEGRVLRPLDPQEVERAVADLVAAGARSIAVCFLWSFRNPTHERWVRDFIQSNYPEIHVTISADLVPVIREYERANTTAVNAYLQPVLDRYVADLSTRLRREHAHEEFLIMQSIGGVAPAQEVRRVPVTTLYSGPVGGIIAARQLGQLLGERNLVTTDMGGTSFDVGLIVDGEAETSESTVIQRQLLMVPAVQVATIGAGGGSVAWLDSVGTLRVGPQSQGAVPGPACYDRGGAEPTVTDADVVLGYINPDSFLGGDFPLRRDAAVRALEERVAGPLGMSVTDAAAAIYTIVNAHMADLIRRVSIGRGYDPRHFTLVAFGGCGPTHVTGYGPEIGARKIVIPALAPVFSAFGIGSSEVRHFYASSVRLTVERGRSPHPDDLSGVQAAFDLLVARAREQLTRDRAPALQTRLELAVDVCYQGQVHELTVPIEADSFRSLEGVQVVLAAFDARYEQRYGRGATSEMAAYQITMVRVSAVAPNPHRVTPVGERAGKSDPGRAQMGTRDVYWPAERGYVQTPIYRGEQLAPGQRLSGPAVVEMYATTVPLHPDQALEVDEWRNLVVVL